MDRAPIVFPIRFAAGDTAVQTTTRELSERGVLVRCLEPPPAGTPLSMKLYLPGAHEALLLDGVVREHANPGDEPWFSIRTKTRGARFPATTQTSRCASRRCRTSSWSTPRTSAPAASSCTPRTPRLDRKSTRL